MKASLENIIIGFGLGTVIACMILKILFGG